MRSRAPGARSTTTRTTPRTSSAPARAWRASNVGTVNATSTRADDELQSAQGQGRDDDVVVPRAVQSDPGEPNQRGASRHPVREKPRQLVSEEGASTCPPRCFGARSVLYVRVVRLSTFCAVAGAGPVAVRRALRLRLDDRVGLRDQSRMVAARRRARSAVVPGAAQRSGHDDLEPHDGRERPRGARRRRRAMPGEVGGLEKDIAHLPQVAMAKLSSFVFGVVHREWSNRGYVACIERGGDGGLAGLATDLRDVAQTGDIAKLGTFRYVSVDRGPGATKTHVLRQWTEGEFNLSKLFPATGDVPGSRSPRGRASRRRATGARRERRGVALRRARLRRARGARGRARALRPRAHAEGLEERRARGQRRRDDARLRPGGRGPLHHGHPQRRAEHGLHRLDASTHWTHSRSTPMQPTH